MQVSLIEFSVENFRIFKEKAVFSMGARKSDHTFERNGEDLLKTSLIYGANASGKTTLLDAFNLMSTGIIFSATQPITESVVPYTPFMFSSETEGKPISFEIIFSIDSDVYRYNFSLLKDHIVSENLYEVLPSSEKKCFSRLNEEYEFGVGFEESGDIVTKTRRECLFLSASAQWNNKLALNIYNAFQEHITIVDSRKTREYGAVTAEDINENSRTKEKVLQLLQKADFCISDIEVVEEKKVRIAKGENKEVVHFTAFLLHKIYDKFGKSTRVGKLNILSEESQGTKQFFEVLGPIIDTLDRGKILWIDEFDNSLHPLLTKLIIDLFESKTYNPLNAQLVVTTHDTSLLSYKDEFIKEQFWFTEKDNFGAGKLFSLAEYSELRNDTEFSKKYLEGRFGALPMIDFEK